MGVPSVPQSNHFETLATVSAESPLQQREGTIRDKNAADARLAMTTLIDICVPNAARNDCQRMTAVTDKGAEPLVRVSVKNDSTDTGVVPTTHSTVPPSECPEISHFDNPA